MQHVAPGVHRRAPGRHMPHTLRTVTGIAVGFVVGVAATSTLHHLWTLFIRWVLGRGD